MNKKQKKMLHRIILTFCIWIPLVVLMETGIVPWMNEFPWGLLVFLIPYGIIGWDILYGAARNIKNGQVFDEDFLMALATIGAFVVGEYMEAVAVMLFFQVGELFQSYAVNRSRQSISDLMDICPEYANVEEDGQLVQVDPDDVSVGDVIVVKSGERIPLDGVVLEGESLVDTSALTGESVPRRVKPGSEIISGCVNGSGLLRVQVTKEFDDSTVAKILELVENASSKKAKVENFITRFARYYTPIVVIAALVLGLLPPIFLSGWTWNGYWSQAGDWLLRACTFLVISCPCALVISVPLSFFGGIGAASRIGVLVKGSNFLEALSHLDTIVFDKTGTLTKGEFTVSERYPAQNVGKDELLGFAALAEYYSNHPIAQSIRDAWEKEPGREYLSMNKMTPVSAEELAGFGVKTQLEDRVLYAGNTRLMEQLKVDYISCDRPGTVVYLAEELNGQRSFLGALVIADALKEDAAEAIQDLKKTGIRKTVMLTGDRKVVGEAVAAQLGLDEVHTDLLPGDKVEQVERLLEEKEKQAGSSKARLAFVGDGINDAPVLSRADIGIAMGSLGSDAAIEAADVVLMDDDTRKIAGVVRVSRKTMNIVRQNIVFALGVKFLVLILGAIGYANMWAAVFADVGVSVIAILNSMRMLRMKAMKN